MGRRSKGERGPLLGCRASIRLDSAVRLEAQDRGMTISDFIATTLAEALQMPEEAPKQPAARQDRELPLTG